MGRFETASKSGKKIPTTGKIFPHHAIQKKKEQISHDCQELQDQKKCPGEEIMEIKKGKKANNRLGQ